VFAAGEPDRHAVVFVAVHFFIGSPVDRVHVVVGPVASSADTAADLNDFSVPRHDQAV
jgi:hypothetical protein